MRHRTAITVLVLSGAVLLSHESPAGLREPPGSLYLSPRPGAARVSPWTAIAIRPGPAGAGVTAVGATGAKSGGHAGELKLAADGATWIFTPAVPFVPGERVEVSVAVAGRPIAGFGFSVADADPRVVARRATCALQEALRGAPGPPPVLAEAKDPSGTLPPAYPPITLETADDPDPGAVFLAPFNVTSPGHLCIVDNGGMPLFYRTLQQRAIDFKMQPNGLLTYYAGDRFYALDDAFTVVDSFAAGNGYSTDLHELQILPNGHALLMSYDPQPVRMDSVVAGGDPDAVVIGLIIQELDTAKNVVFEWRSWDHFAITDAAVPGGEDLTAPLVDYVHGNAIERDSDGNLLISSRHLNEITKIDRQTGDVIWRMGMHAINNEFTFHDDPRGFTYQHDIRRLPNGNITLFDNGNLVSPSYSRVVEYRINENGKQVWQEWEYQSSPNAHAVAMGNAQRRPGGATTIGWGTALSPQLSEIHEDGTTAYELSFPQHFTYRAFRFPWQNPVLTASVEDIHFGVVAVGDTASVPFTVRNNAPYDVTLTEFISTGVRFDIAGPLPLTLPPEGEVQLQAVFHPFSGISYTADIYVRSVTGTELLAEGIHVTGLGDGPLAVEDPPGVSTPTLLPGRPNPFRGATSIEFRLETHGPARLRVFDSGGRLVRTLAEGVFTAGAHRFVWDGRTDSGRPVGTGVFFCRLTTRELTHAVRLVRIP